MPTRKTVPEGIRITKVGLWYIGLAVLVGVPAANTGNNALYLVEACLLALLVVSGITSRQNLRRLELELIEPEEIYAGQPFGLGYSIRQRGRLWARRLLVIAGIGEGKPVLVPFLPRGQIKTGTFELTASRRGLLRVPFVHLSSIYPLGLFRKGMRFRVDCELLVFPQLLPAARSHLRAGGASGENPAARSGMGHELLTLRSFQPGDDRRNIHWKQTARTGDLIYMEREAEKGRRVSILFDNTAPDIRDPAGDKRFERLVSEAATAVDHFVEQGFEVELITRGDVLGFGRGHGHRRRLLETLALISQVSRRSGRDLPLMSSDPEASVMRFAIDGGQA